MLFSQLPGHFYYTVASEGIRYAQFGTGTPSAARLLNGLPAFPIVCETQGQRKTKALVVNDPLLSHYAFRDHQTILVNLQALESQGFACYYATASGLTPFVLEENEEQLTTIVDQAVVSETQIHQWMANENYGPEQILILDSAALHNPPFTPNYQFLTHIKQKTEDLESFIAHFNNRTHLQNVSISLKNEEDIDYWQSLCPRLLGTFYQVRVESAHCYQRLQTKPNLQALIQHLHLDFSDVPSEHPGWNHLQGLEALTIDKTSSWLEQLPPEHGKQINALKLRNITLTPRQIEYVLANMPALQTLAIDNCSLLMPSLGEDNSYWQEPPGPFDIHLHSLTHLKKLQIRSSGFGAIVETLLSQSPELETIEIDELSLSSTATLPTLRQLTHAFIHAVSEKSAQVFLTNTPALVALKINQLNVSKNEPHDFILPENALRHLTDLQLSNAQKKTILAIVQACCQLKHLHIKTCHNKTPISWAHPNLCHLTKLELDSITISTEEFEHLLSITKKLEELLLYRCEGLAHFTLAHPLPLKKLYLEDLTIPTDAFHQLISSHLQELHFEACDQVDLSQPLKWPTLPALNNLKLFGITICAMNLSALLSPALNYLWLDDLELKGTLDLNEKIFPRLVSCQLSHVDTTTGLLGLLPKAKHLRHLDLTGYEITHQLSLAECSWPDLKTLCINGESKDETDDDDSVYDNTQKAHFTTDFFHSLFKAAPALAKLGLINGKLIGKLAPDYAWPLQHLVLSGIQSTDDQLKHLLQLTAFSLEILEFSDLRLNAYFYAVDFVFLKLKKFQCNRESLKQLSAQSFLEQSPYLDAGNRLDIQKEINRLLAEQKRLQNEETPTVESVEPHRTVVDLNTSLDSSQPMLAKKYFSAWSNDTPESPLNEYRLTVYEKIAIEEDRLLLIQSEPSFIEQSLPVTSETEVVFESGFAYHQAKKECCFDSPHQKIFLPSLHAQENIVFLRTTPTVQHLQLFYCPEYNLYAVQANECIALTLHYGIAIDHQPIAIPELDPLIKQYRAYKASRPLEGDHPQAILDDIITNHIGGACRFLAAAFYQQSQSLELPPHIKIRLLDNDLHAYIEVSNDRGRTWHLRHLGGTPANIICQDPWQKSRVNVQDVPIPAAITPMAPEAYCHMLFNDQNLRKLVIFKEAPEILAFQAYFHALFHGQSDSEVITVNNPDCLHLAPQRLRLTSQVDGALLEQINQPHNALLERLALTLAQQPTKKFHILIHWSEFTASQLVQFNTMLDDGKRRLHHVEFPDNVIFYSLVTTGQSRDDSVRSRHDAVFNNPCSLTDLQQHVSVYYDKPSELSTDPQPYVVDLYHSNDWEALLYGSLSLGQHGVQFHHGDLLTAWQREESSLCLANAPWHLTDFQLFWQSFVRQPSLQLYGQTFSFAPHIQLSHTTGYPQLNTLVESCQWTLDPPPESAYPLNPTTLAYCFNTYRLDNDHLLTAVPWLQAATDQSLSFYVTRALTLDQWMRLLTAAQRHRVRLHMHLAPQLELPPPMSQLVHYTAITTPTLPALIQAQLLVTADPYQAACQLQQRDYPEALVIGVTDRSNEDWFQALTNIQLSATGITAQKETYAIWHALTSGQTVILYGEFSKEHSDVLASFFLPQPRYFFNHEAYRFNGRLICISNQAAHLAFVPSSHRYPWQAEPKPRLLVNHWLEPKTSPKIAATPSNALAFEQKRAYSVARALQHCQCLVIEGTSGSGKNHFFYDDRLLTLLANQLGACHFYHDVNSLQRWASDASGFHKILIIKDSHQCDFNFHMLLDSLRHQPSLFIKGRYYTLTAFHRIILLGQFSAPLPPALDTLLTHTTMRHTWQTLPNWYVSAQIIAPLLATIAYPKGILDQILQVFIKRHQQLQSLSLQALKTMALLLQNAIHSAEAESGPIEEEAMQEWDTSENQGLIASISREVSSLPCEEGSNVIYQDWLANQQKSATPYYAVTAEINTIITHFKWLARPSSAPLTPTMILGNSQDFILTASRHPAYSWMEKLLTLRHLRQTVNHSAWQGINALLLEGPAGIGKTELLNYFITKMELVAADPHQADFRPNIYYRLSAAALNLEAMLLKAFDEGAVVIIHEFNTAKISQRLLKSLLAGKTLDNQAPRRAGFLLLADQNPLFYAGRQPLNKDLLAYFAFLTMTEYPKRELEEILNHRFPALTNQQYQPLIDRYQQERSAASHNPTFTAPNLRNLLRWAQELVPFEPNVHLSAPTRSIKTSMPSLKRRETDSQEALNVLNPSKRRGL